MYQFFKSFSFKCISNLKKRIFKQPNNFVTKQNIIYKNQFGFQQNMSIEIAISKINDDYTNIIEKTFIIFLYIYMCQKLLTE